MTLYAFVRFFDDIVDYFGNNPQEDRQILHMYRDQVEQAWKGKIVEIQIINDFVLLAKQKNIAKEWVDAFLDAMESDTIKNTYLTYSEVQSYMYGSAETIWLMMLSLIGYNQTHKESVIIAARQLGEAMQYTNFLRDIQEDWINYKRIYLPLEELDKYWITQKELIELCTTKALSNQHRHKFMKAQIDKTRILYRSSEKYISDLHESGQLPVRIALHMYEAILDTIENNWYQTFSTNNKTSLRKKIQVFVAILRKSIPQRHRWIWIFMTMLFVWSLIAYLFNIPIPFRDHPLVTTGIFVGASLPIVFQNKQRRRKLLFVGSMFGVEVLWHSTGFPFGQYMYHHPWNDIGFFGVPIFIAFSWLLLINIASNITKNRWWTLILVVWIDLILEPFASFIGYWTRTWNHILTAPISNYLSRWIIAFISYWIVSKRKISRLRSLLMYLSIFLYAAIVLLIE